MNLWQFWVNLANFGYFFWQFGAILGNLGQFDAIQFRAISGNFRQFRAISAFLGGYGKLKARNLQFFSNFHDAIRSNLRQF